MAKAMAGKSFEAIDILGTFLDFGPDESWVIK
jgi:hypothetical protein